jgi:hypothetical protein
MWSHYLPMPSNGFRLPLWASNTLDSPKNAAALVNDTKEDLYIS